VSVARSAPSQSGRAPSVHLPMARACGRLRKSSVLAITRSGGIGGTSPRSSARRTSLAPARPIGKLEKLVADESLSIIDHLRIVRGALYSAFDTAISVGDRLLLDRLAGRLHENLRDCARLTDELQRGPLFVQNNVSITQTHDFSLAVAAIVKAVSPYSEARAAVVAALRELDARVGVAPQIEHAKSPETIDREKAKGGLIQPYAAPADQRTERVNA